MKKISKKTWRIIEIVGVVVFLIIFAINFKMLMDTPSDSAASAEAKGWFIFIFPALVFFEFATVFMLPLFLFLLIRGILVGAEKTKDKIEEKSAPESKEVSSKSDNPFQKIISVLGYIFTWPKVLIFCVVVDTIMYAFGMDQTIKDSIISFQSYLIVIMIVKLIVSGVRGK